MALPRVLDNYLTAWDEYVEPRPAAKLFKEWGGIGILSMVMGRKTWVQTNPTFPPIFPVVWPMFVGPPASGKDMIINLVSDLLKEVAIGMGPGKGFNIGPESFSVKGLIDALADDDAEFTFEYKQKNKKLSVTYHSLLLCLPELGTFLPEYNTHLVSCMNDLYNCKPAFADRVRGRGAASLVTINNPHLGLLLGTQPATLTDIIPEQAFQMGFTSRINMIVTRDVEVQPLFQDTVVDKSALWQKLVSDTRAIATLTGPFTTTKEYRNLVNDFHLKAPGRLTYSRFEDYNARRSLHLNKLAMICSAAEGNKQTLTAEHFHQAKAFLFRAEASAPLVFEDIKTSNGFHHTVESITHKGGTISHAELERKLRKTHKPYEVGTIIKHMISAGDLIPEVTKVGQQIYHMSKELQP